MKERDGVGEFGVLEGEDTAYTKVKTKGKDLLGSLFAARETMENTG